ncbi:MAG TPA: SPW repeat protein, partial [Thermoanaerobaculia bacterium]|nr:SPW repeat protein [Thermoanaerobaculia bacterium]
MSNWPRYVNTALGLWWMAAPAVLGYGDPAQTNDRIVGPLAATFAIIAIWETTRECRRINLALGIWQLLAPWVLPLFGGAYPADATFNSMACGAVLAACSLVRG